MTRRRLFVYPTVPPVMEAQVTAPAEVTISRSLYAATHPSVVHRSSTTFSQVFSFHLVLGVRVGCSASHAPNDAFPGGGALGR